MEHYGDRSVIGKILWQDTIPQPKVNLMRTEAPCRMAQGPLP